MAVTAGDRIYVIGGSTPGPKDTAVPLPGLHWSLGTVEEYDPATHTWRQRSAMPPSRNHATAGLVNGKIYVIGGRVSVAGITTTSNTNAVEQYDPGTDAWAGRARMPTARSAMASGVYGGRIYVTGASFRTAR